MRKPIGIFLLLIIFLIFSSVQNVFAGGTISLTGDPYVGNEISIIAHLDTKDCPSTQTEFKIENLNVDQKDANFAQPTYENRGTLPLDFTNSEIHTLVNGNDLGGFKYVGEQEFVAWFPNSTATADDDPIFSRNDDLQIIVTKVKVAQPGKANINATVHLYPEWDRCVSLNSNTYTYDMNSGIIEYSFKPEFNFIFDNPPSITPTSVPTSTPIPTYTPSPTPTNTPIPTSTPYPVRRLPTIPPLHRIIFPIISLFPPATPTPFPVVSPTQTPSTSPTITPFFNRHLFR